MRAPLATFLVLGLAAAARAADPAPEEKKPDAPAAESAAPAASSDKPASFDPFASKDYSKDLAAAEKAAGRDYVWDGMKMIPAPDNFKSPLTPEAAAAGWRPVIVGGEVQGVCNGNQCTSKEMQPGLFAPNAPTPPPSMVAQAANSSANWCDQPGPPPPCAPKDENKAEEPKKDEPPQAPQLNAQNTATPTDIAKTLQDQDKFAAKGGQDSDGPLGPGTGGASTERPATQPPSGGGPAGPAGSGSGLGAMGQVGQDSSGGLGAGRQVRCQDDDCYKRAADNLHAVLNAAPPPAGPSGPGETVVESAGRLGSRRSMVQANALKRDLEGRVSAAVDARDDQSLDDQLATSAIENPGEAKAPIKVRKDCKNVFGIEVVCPQ